MSTSCPCSTLYSYGTPERLMYLTIVLRLLEAEHQQVKSVLADPRNMATLTVCLDQSLRTHQGLQMLWMRKARGSNLVPFSYAIRLPRNRRQMDGLRMLALPHLVPTGAGFEGCLAVPMTLRTCCLVDPASSHTLFSKIKSCICQV